MTATSDAHVRPLQLKRFWAGELGGAEAPAVEAHTASCAQCRARLKQFTDEQKRFEQQISFDRFAAGVERAARTPRAVRAERPAAWRWFFPVLSVAAAVALTITLGPRSGRQEGGANRIKGGGGSGITVQVAPAAAGPQRTALADAPEALSAGERIRIGYQAGAHRYLTSVSVDEQGQVTPLYPETGRSVPIAPKAAGAGVRYLPDSVEFTGQGRERLIVILGDQPLDVEAVKRAARAAYQKASGDLTRMAPLDLPGEQFQRTFVKP
jgi:hypothetical protein